MKPIPVFLIALSVALLTAGCHSSATNGKGEDIEPFERRELPRQITESESAAIDGAGDFGFDLMQRLTEDDEDKNHFISPLSIQMAFGMVMNGAEGETYRQMQEVFGLEEMSREQVNRTAQELTDLLTGFDENVQFTIANSIWYRNSFEAEEGFLEANRAYYDAAVEAADFDDPETVERINGWVDEKTEGLIDEIVKGPIDPLTVMFLINAIHYEGEWTVPFDPDNTKEQPFYRSDGSSVQTDMMELFEQEQMQYAEGDNYRAVNLYYGDAGYAMTLVLPDEEAGLQNWLNNMDREQWLNLTDGFREVTLTLEMPKFEQEYEVENFKSVLQQMGLTDAFDPGESDFSRINSEQEDLHISDTRHKTFIRVNEEGTEAAAATSVEMGVTSAPQSIQISFNRPFFYVIREVESEAILFMGIMNDPVM